MMHACRMLPTTVARASSRKRRLPANVEWLEPRTLLTLLGQQLFPADNAWNQKITSAPVASTSGAMIQNIVNQYGDGRFHPEFAEDSNRSDKIYGIPYNVVHGNTQAKVHVVIDDYAASSDIIDAPIPAGAVLEGDNENGPVSGLGNRGDSHLLIYDVDNNVVYEFYNASRPSENSDGKWHAAQETYWDLKTNTFRTLGMTSADAAGLSILPGLVRPDEALPVSQGGQGVINHAIRVTLQNSVILNKFIYPASHIANPGNTNAAIQVPMGTRLRLKANVDISGLSPQSKIIAQAMKDYGLIVADNGGNFFATGASYSVDANNKITKTWDDDDIQDQTRGLKSLHYSDFEIVDLTPIVTGLSASSGSAGSTMTITGSNFSGAAGRLQVLFGTTAATNVTVLDDSHVTATVPAGSGTVDVRVQSGINTNYADNIKKPIYGYGISNITTADKFTYGSGGGGGTTNYAPTVSQSASASPSTVTGITTSLAVLGADDAGESALKYQWKVLTSPTGATPTFSANGTNASKATTVTFNRAGSYSFRVTITDAGGLSATSDVSVVVNQTITTVRLTPSSVTLKRRATQQFTASALDQFGQALTTQPKFTWSRVSGVGSINSSGVYTAPNRSGSAVIQAKASGKVGQASIQVVAQTATATKFAKMSAVRRTRWWG